MLQRGKLLVFPVIALLASGIAATPATAAMEPAGKFNPRYWEPTPEDKELYRVFESLNEYQIGSQLGPALQPSPCGDQGLPDCTMEHLPNLAGQYMLDGCENAQDPICLEEIVISDESGSQVPGRLEFYYENPWQGHDQRKQPGNLDLGIPEGEMMSIWRFPGVEHEGGTDLYILKFVTYWVSCQESDSDYCEFGKPIYIDLRFSLIPYSLYKYSSYQDGGLMPANSQTGDGRAGIIESFREGTSLSLSIRAPSSIGDWVRIRAEEVSVDAEAISPDTTRLRITGKPTSVPGLYVIADPITDPWGNVMRQVGFGPDQLWAAEKLRGPAGDRASGEIRIFTFETMASPAGDSWTYKKCSDEVGGFGGFVASNAMFYARGAPEFSNGYLSYQIAGMHYLSDGSLAKGNYEMVINKEFASCLYGVETISPNATVQVINEAGVEEVAVSTVTDDGEWLRLSASNFTFSTKEIRVALNKTPTWSVAQKTLAAFPTSSTTLTETQKMQVRAAVEANPNAEKFICTGIRYFDQPMSQNILVRKRAKAACEYAEQLNPNLSTWYQNKPTQARSYNGKVLLTIKTAETQ